jgi:DNA-3-methyladenine glycosylase
MFGPPGVAYVYFVYGMHEMLNFVTEPEGCPGAVLIRAVEPLLGEKLMARRRGGLAPRQWTSGPGRLCRAMGIRQSHQGQELTGPRLFVADDGWRPEAVLVSPRVGISVGVERPWRFFVAGNPYVSRVRENLNARPDRRRPAWPKFRRRSR